LFYLKRLFGLSALIARTRGMGLQTWFLSRGGKAKVSSAAIDLKLNRRRPRLLFLF
jgi:hypothetical protein